MYNLIFDIDDTLYQKENLNYPFDYGVFKLFVNYDKETNPNNKQKIIETIIYNYTKMFKINNKLNELLKNIKYPKHIITNSRKEHCFISLHSIGIKHNFNIILNADTQPTIKPYQLIYDHFENLDKRKYQNIFFDDKIENLAIPKKKGWITFLINPKKYNKIRRNNIKYWCVDYCFPDICTALEYFIKYFK